MGTVTRPKERVPLLSERAMRRMIPRGANCSRARDYTSIVHLVNALFAVVALLLARKALR